MAVRFKTSHFTVLGGAAAVAILVGAMFWMRSDAPRTADLRPVERGDASVASDSALPTTPAAQKAKVESLLAKGDYESALLEAQVYYDVAPLKETHKAVEYITAALARTRGQSDPTLVSRFLEQQSLGARTASGKVPGQPVLARASADPARYADALEQTKDASTYPELMSRGDLLLLAGQPQQARQVFLVACKLAKVNNKQLFDAVEGVARAIRAEDGVMGRANALVLTLMLGEQLPAEMQGALDDLFARGELQVAGQRVILPQLSKRAAAGTTAEQAGDDSDEPSATAGGFETFDMGDPIVIAAVSPQPDEELIAWLLRWHAEAKAGRPTISKDEQIGLWNILVRTSAPCVTLFHLGRTFQLHAGDGVASTSALFYTAAAERVEAELRTSVDPKRVATIVRAMKDHMGGYKKAFWPLIEKNDQRAARALLTIYQCYAQYAPPTDGSLSRPIIHTKIGAAGCLYKMGRLEDALTLLDALNGSKMERGEQIAFDWAYGLVLYQLNRFSEAVPRLQRTAETQSPHTRYAWPLLIIACARAGDGAGALRYRDQWIERFAPPDTEVKQVLKWLAQGDLGGQ